MEIKNKKTKPIFNCKIRSNENVLLRDAECNRTKEEIIIKQLDEAIVVKVPEVEDVHERISTFYRHNGDFITGSQLLSLDIKEMPFLLQGLLPKTGLACIAGGSDTGKSAFLRHLAIEIVNGSEEFIGKILITKHKRVLYISTEDNDLAVSALINMQKGKFVDNTASDRLMYIFETNDLLKKIEQIVKRNPIDCLIVDALTDIFSGDLNAAASVRPFLQDYDDLAKKYGYLTLFLHHTGKGKEEKAPSKNSLLGSQGFEAKMRSVLILKTDKFNPENRLLFVVKGNYLPDSEKNKGISLLFKKDLTFEYTGQMVDLEYGSDYRIKAVKKMDNKFRILELSEQGKTTREIAEIMESEGTPVSKSTVAVVIKEEKEEQEFNEPKEKA